MFEPQFRTGKSWTKSKNNFFFLLQKIKSPLVGQTGDYVVGGVKAYLADDLLLVWENGQPHRK